MKYSSLGIATAIAVLIALVAAQPAAADDVRCTGFLPPGVYDNVVVPESAFCSMENTVVRGNVKALSNSHLHVAGGNHIGGNVEGDKALQVQIFHFPATQPNVINGNGVIVQDTFATIICGALLPSGNIIIVKNRGDFLEIGGGRLCEVAGGGNKVQRGNIKVEDSVISREFDVSNNSVAQNLQVYKNTGPAAKRVMNNMAGESVQCFDNTQPFIGGPNFAPKREGQCFF